MSQAWTWLEPSVCTWELCLAAALSCRALPRGNSSMTQQQYEKKKKTDPTFVTSNWGRVPLMHIKHAFILVAYSAPNVLNFFLAPSSISWVFFLFTEFLHTALKVKLCFYITEKRGIIVLTLQTDTCTSNCLLSSRTIGSYAPNKSFGSGDLWFIESWIDVYSQPNCQT